MLLGARYPTSLDFEMAPALGVFPQTVIAAHWNELETMRAGLQRKFESDSCGGILIGIGGTRHWPVTARNGESLVRTRFMCCVLGLGPHTTTGTSSSWHFSLEHAQEMARPLGSRASRPLRWGKTTARAADSTVVVSPAQGKRRPATSTAKPARLSS